MGRDHDSQYGFYQEAPSDGISILESRCDELSDSSYAQEAVHGNLNDEASRYHGTLDVDGSTCVDESYCPGNVNLDEYFFTHNALEFHPHGWLDGQGAFYPVIGSDINSSTPIDPYITRGSASHYAAENIDNFSLDVSSWLPLDYGEPLRGTEEFNDISNIRSQFQHSEPNLLFPELFIPFPKDETPFSNTIATNVDNTMPATGSIQGPESVQQPVIGLRKEWPLPPLKRRGRKPKTPAPSPKQKQNDPSNPKTRPRRSRPLEPEVRRQATIKRQQKLVCVICHFKKEACHQDPSTPDGPCLRCKFALMPCVRYRITDAALYREQKAPFYLFSQRWKTMEMPYITEWADDEVVTTKFSLIALNAPYELKLRRVIPRPGDNFIQSHSVNGRTMTYSIPPYGIANMEEAAASIWSMVERELGNYLWAFVGQPGTDPIIWETYAAAFKRADTAPTPQEQMLLLDTLRLWTCCRNTSSPEHIVGEEKLGMRKVDDPSSYLHGKFPGCGSVIAAQLECIYYTKFLRPLSRNVLRSLMALLTTRDKKYWFTIYLVLFMLLHSCSMVTRRDMETAIFFNLPTEYCNPIGIREHKTGAKTLLAYYHLALRGSVPFKQVLDGNPLDSSSLGLSEDDVRVVTRSSHLAASQKSKWDEIRKRGDCGDDFYWISQLYDQNWKPEKMD
ncbi:hypothetical protein F4775DRAFT_548764 [Biscogniauxia sp. FL1348]|nr:hypothetical protein F4775DRAFT_548764 [Biscogniauxia sp. FL1348]